MANQTATTIKAQNVPQHILDQIEALLNSANVEHTTVTNELVELEVSVNFAKVAEESAQFNTESIKAQIAASRKNRETNSTLANIL